MSSLYPHTVHALSLSFFSFFSLFFCSFCISTRALLFSLLSLILLLFLYQLYQRSRLLSSITDADASPLEMPLLNTLFLRKTPLISCTSMNLSLLLIYIVRWKRATHICHDRALLYYTEKKYNIMLSRRYANTAIFPTDEGRCFHSRRANIFIPYIHPCADKIADRPGYNRFISRRRWSKEAEPCATIFFSQNQCRSRTPMY